MHRYHLLNARRKGEAMTPTTFTELMESVLKLFPDAIVSEDEHGEIIVATGLRQDGDTDNLMEAS